MKFTNMIGLWEGRPAVLNKHGDPVAVSPPGVETFREFEDMVSELDSGVKTYDEGYDDGWKECEKDAEGCYDDGFRVGRSEAEKDAALKAAAAAAPLREALDILTGSEESYDPDVVRNIKKAIKRLERMS